MERALLTPLNDDVDALNLKMNQAFHLRTSAARETYLSADSAVDSDDANDYPIEFLNSLNFSGMPPHALHLQVGCPIILLRNLASGLANGTRLIVLRLMSRCIEGEVATGPLKGRRVFISLLNLTPTDTDMPFRLRRRQFPVKPAFAMTINKSQGQTFAAVGLYLPTLVFGHGQLYVGKSRVGDPNGCKVLVPGSREKYGRVLTQNVVYKELLIN